MNNAGVLAQSVDLPPNKMQFTALASVVAAAQSLYPGTAPAAVNPPTPALGFMVVGTVPTPAPSFPLGGTNQQGLSYLPILNRMFVQFNQVNPNVGLYVNAQLYVTRNGVSSPIPGATLALGLPAFGTGASFGYVDFSGAFVPGTSTPITPAAVGAPPGSDRLC